MMTDQDLLDAFVAESRCTGSALDGIRAVRIAVQASVEEELSALRSLNGERYQRGQSSLTPAEVTRIMELVAEDLGIDGVDLILFGRGRRALHSRWVFSAVAHHHGLSYPKIALALRLRHHGPALNGVRRLPKFPELVASRDRVLRAFASEREEGSSDGVPVAGPDAQPSQEERAA